MQRTWLASLCGAVLFTSVAVASGPVSLGSPHDKPGFVTAVVEGRLWVFKADDAKNIEEFRQSGELGKMASRIAAGPNRMTIRAPDMETIERYLEAR